MDTNSLLSLTSSQLGKAAELKERIDGLNSELASLLGGNESAASSPAPGTRTMSAAGRARIAAAARARWARVKAEKGQSINSTTLEKPKRTMSASARRKIAAAARARWAKVRAANAGK
jgi:hypothetical protein